MQHSMSACLGTRSVKCRLAALALDHAFMAVPIAAVAH
eukprot:CAMPEP_0168821894 /NCGR_PEP_ID=MMETSP0726-20121227/9660_1 /TAXON_ID=265536 /ORGANISM="Amphiprora sp., Strain CCMP467" /LENGTH=37 /DNA_ID= /DNA_START= /DNA_END= /DNA_ORIENTATION=